MTCSVVGATGNTNPNSYELHYAVTSTSTKHKILLLKATLRIIFTLCVVEMTTYEMETYFWLVTRKMIV